MKKTGFGKKWLLLMSAACAMACLPAAKPVVMAAQSELTALYAADAYILPDSATRYLTKADLDGLTKAELRLARNEIYARHGRIFGNKDLKDYFTSRSWYKGTVPADSFDESSLNQYETKNVELILEAEKTAPTEKAAGSGTKTGSVSTGTGTGTATGTKTGNGTSAGIGKYTGSSAAGQSSAGSQTAGQSSTGSQTANAGTSQGQYILPDSATRKLDASELAGMSKADLRLARNEIFARRGRKFSNSELQKYFNSRSWYKGTIDPDDFDESVLNAYERANVDLITAVESGEIVPNSNTGTAGQGTGQASQAGQIVPAFSGSEAQAMTETFAYWLVGSMTEFPGLDNALRISMSYDVLEPEYAKTGRLDRKTAEALMQNVFGSSFRPTDDDYAEAGWKVNASEIDFQVGDWGEDEPESTLLSFDNLGNNRYEAVILYQRVDWPDVEDWCTVRWQFGWDSSLKAYVITDAAKELADGSGLDDEEEMLVDDVDDEMDDDLDDEDFEDDDLDEDDMDDELDEDEEEMMIQVFVDDNP